MTNTIYIHGADSRTGYAIAKEIREKRVQNAIEKVFVGVINPQSEWTKKLKEIKDLEFVQATREDEYLDALRKSEWMVLVPVPEMIPNEWVQNARQAIESAKKSPATQGLAFVSSVCSKEQNGEILKNLFVLEEEVKRAPVPNFVILRTSLYFENFLLFSPQIQQDRELKVMLIRYIIASD